MEIAIMTFNPAWILEIHPILVLKSCFCKETLHVILDKVDSDQARGNEGGGHPAYCIWTESAIGKIICWSKDWKAHVGMQCVIAKKSGTEAQAL